MSKIGIVRDSISVNKPVKLEYINKIETTVNKITIHYTAGNFGGSNDSELVILLANPNTFAYTSAYIRERVLKWISDGLASTSALTLNDYLGDIVPTQVAVVGTQTLGQIISAADSAAACAATPNINVGIDSTGTPLVGTGIYLVTSPPTSEPTAPVAAGNYALSFGSSQYFITVNSVSNISYIEVCPLLLDFVYNLQNLTSPITAPNPDAISFAINGGFPFDPGTISYNAYYNPPAGAATDVPEFELCGDFGPNRAVYGPDNAYWPVGIINNATTNIPNFAVSDVAFGLQLNDSNVANFFDAQLYISFDLNANAGVVEDATFVPFVLSFGQNPAFTGSPLGGIPGFGDGTTTFSPGNTGPMANDSMTNLFRNNLFLPAGSSLQGTANFTDGAYCNWDFNNGRINNVVDNTCLS